MKSLATLFLLMLAVGSVRGQIQVELKFKRLQYVAYEPVIATLKITNLAGRPVDLQDGNDQRWFGFEVTLAFGATAAHRAIHRYSCQLSGGKADMAALQNVRDPKRT